jgi:hypothetical protein
MTVLYCFENSLKPVITRELKGFFYAGIICVMLTKISNCSIKIV